MPQYLHKLTLSFVNYYRIGRAYYITSSLGSKVGGKWKCPTITLWISLSLYTCLAPRQLECRCCCSVMREKLTLRRRIPEKATEPCSPLALPLFRLLLLLSLQLYQHRHSNRMYLLPWLLLFEQATPPPPPPSPTETAWTETIHSAFTQRQFLLLSLYCVLW